jgi:hypothetical protein
MVTLDYEGTTLVGISDIKKKLSQVFRHCDAAIAIWMKMIHLGNEALVSSVF